MRSAVFACLILPAFVPFVASIPADLAAPQKIACAGVGQEMFMGFNRRKQVKVHEEFFFAKGKEGQITIITFEYPKGETCLRGMITKVSAGLGPYCIGTFSGGVGEPYISMKMYTEAGGSINTTIAIFAKST